MINQNLEFKIRNSILTKVLFGYLSLTTPVYGSFSQHNQELVGEGYKVSQIKSNLERKCTDGRVDRSGIALPEIETKSDSSPELREASIAVEEALRLIPNWVQELEPCAYDYIIFVDGAKSFTLLKTDKKSKIVLDDNSYFFNFTDRKTGKVLPHVYVNVRPFNRILLPMLQDKDKRKETLARISTYLAHELAERRGSDPFAAENVQTGHLLNIHYINPNFAETLRAETLRAQTDTTINPKKSIPLRVVVHNRP